MQTVILKVIKRIFVLLLITFIAPTFLFSIPYDRDAVATYADTWWDDRNPNYNNYSPNDCANFVSQCLIAGRVNLSEGPGVDDKGCIPNCDNLDYNLYWYQNAEWNTITYPSTNVPSNLTKGDVIIFGDVSGDRYKHSVIVVGGTGSNVYCDAHDNDRWHKSITWWYGDGEDQFGRANFYHMPNELGIEEYYIQVNSPNGGEVWYYDETHNITWNTGTLAETPADSVIIHYSTDGGSTYPYRIAKVVNSSGDFPWYGSYSWTIPRNPSTSCKVRVRGYFQSDPYYHGDASDDNFTIKNPLYLSGWMEWINPPKSPKSGVEPMDVNHYRAHLYWTFNASYTPSLYGLYRKLKYPLPGDPTGWVRIYYGSNKSYVDPYDFQLGSGAWYYVRAYITGVPYIQSNTIYLAPGIQTSSFIYVWDGKEFIEDSNILAGSGNEEIEEDWCKLREGPVEEGNRYRLQIREEGNEYSFFDKVRFMAIDHPDSIEIFVTPDGDIVPVSSMIASQSVMGENEVDYTSHLLNNDNIYVEANEVDKITGVLPLTVSSEDESLRFIFTDGSRILDHIRFVKRNNAPYHIKPCPLVSATHSDIGSVKQKLLNDDENYAELLPGDTITLEFTAVDIEPEWVRDFVFVSNGYYITETEGGGAQTGYSSIPLVHSLSLYPNPAKNDMNIRFGIPREEKVSLKIYDVSGREVKMLVDDRLEAGYHIIKLDSENLPSGIYFARLVTDNYEATKKLVLMK